MEVNVESFKAYYEDLKAKKAQDIQEALANKDFLVAQKLDEMKAEIAEQVEKSIIAEVEAKYAHDIELCEKFLIAEEVQEEETAYDEEQVAVEA